MQCIKLPYITYGDDSLKLKFISLFMILLFSFLISQYPIFQAIAASDRADCSFDVIGITRKPL